MFLFSIVLPFLFQYYYNQAWFVQFLMVIYIIYYTLIFIETMRQITRRDEVTLSVVLGSFCGYLLLSLIAAFSFFIIEFKLCRILQWYHPQQCICGL